MIPGAPPPWPLFAWPVLPVGAPEHSDPGLRDPLWLLTCTPRASSSFPQCSSTAGALTFPGLPSWQWWAGLICMSLQAAPGQLSLFQVFLFLLMTLNCLVTGDNLKALVSSSSYESLLVFLKEA